DCMFKNKIKIYSDGAEKKSMLDLANNPVIKGFTTNPSLMKQARVSDYKPYCLELIQAIPDKPISFEVFADDFPGMKRRANQIAAWCNNVYFKVTLLNSKGESSLPLIKELSAQGIKLNI